MSLASDAIQGYEVSKIPVSLRSATLLKMQGIMGTTRNLLAGLALQL